jgi:hypothetical protein
VLPSILRKIAWKTEQAAIVFLRPNLPAERNYRMSLTT